MITNVDKLTEQGCGAEQSDKVCRSRGGESCAFDGAMIVLQPIADAAHIVHGPIACCGNSWEGRGSLTTRGVLHRMGFTTDLSELDIVYGSEEKLYKAILQTFATVRPKAIFVHATCVSGLIGEDIEAVCKKAAQELQIKVIPVNAPGFVGPKNLGNRIAGEVLLEHVIGTGEPPLFSSPLAKGGLRGVDINLIGEYNIAGDLWIVEPLLRRAGLRVLSRMTGDSTFEEITYAHKADMNVVVCSRALINVAKGMQQKYGIPYVEVSFFGKTEMSKALRAVSQQLSALSSELTEGTEELIAAEEQKLQEKLGQYSHLRGKKAVLYTGGVKSWSLISALQDLGIEIMAVGTKKSTFEDEEKMREILGPEAPLVENVAPKNLKKLLRDTGADMLIAGGRNLYLAVKEGIPFVDVNQERHTAYAGYDGLVNLAREISNSIRFYNRQAELSAQPAACSQGNRFNEDAGEIASGSRQTAESCLINPLKHSPAIGAALAFQGIHNALPVIHGAQGCTFLGKVLLTKHFREPIALAGTKLFAEDVVMGSEEKLLKTLREALEKEHPDIIGVLTSGLAEVKGDDVSAAIRQLDTVNPTAVLHVPTPDYAGSLETGYARAVEAIVSLAESPAAGPRQAVKGQINILAGAHLTPADFLELREMAEAFGLRPLILPDLSCLDGSRQGMSPLSVGGTTMEEIVSMGRSEFTLVIGRGLEPAARLLQNLCGVDCRVFDGLSGLKETGLFLEVLSLLSSRPVPAAYERQRRILSDAMRDAQFFLSNRNICLALEPDHAAHMSLWISEMAADIRRTVVPAISSAAKAIRADSVVAGGLGCVDETADLIISNSHAEDTALRLKIPLMQAGFPVWKRLGYTNQVTIGYRGTLNLIQEAANTLLKEVHS